MNVSISKEAAQKINEACQKVRSQGLKIKSKSKIIDDIILRSSDKMLDDIVGANITEYSFITKALQDPAKKKEILNLLKGSKKSLLGAK